MLAFFQSSGTSPILQYFSKMIESGFAVTSASSLRTHGCILSVLTDLCVLKLPTQSLSRSSSTKSFFLQKISWKKINRGIFSMPLWNKIQVEVPQMDVFATFECRSAVKLRSKKMYESALCVNCWLFLKNSIPVKLEKKLHGFEKSLSWYLNICNFRKPTE